MQLILAYPSGTSAPKLNSTWSIRKQECSQELLDIVVSMLTASINKVEKTIWRLLETSLCIFTIKDIFLGCPLLNITITDIIMATLMEQ